MRAAHPDRNIRLLFAYWFLRDFQLWIPVWIVFLTIEQGFSLTQVTTAEGLFLIGGPSKHYGWDSASLLAQIDAIVARVARLLSLDRVR